MASLIPDVIVVNVTFDSAPVTAAGFGVTLHGGPATFSELTRTYATPEEAAEDSALLTSAQLDSINAIFGSNLPPSSTKAGRMLFTFVAQVNTVTVTGTDDGDYTVTINGTPYTFAASSNTADQIASGLQALIDVDPAVSASVLTNVVTITSLTPGTSFTISVTNANSNLALAETTPNQSPATQLDDIVAADPDWFGLVIDSRDEAVILDVAAWAETNNRLFIAQSDDDDVRNATVTDDVLSELQTRQYGLTAFMSYGDSTTPGDSERADGAWQSKLSVNPDSATTIWAHYTLVGIPLDSSLTTSDKNVVLGKGGNVYGQLLGIPVTWPGVTVDGRYIDLRITAEWTGARIQERVTQLLINKSNQGSKVPYTDKGLGEVGNVIAAVLRQGEEAGHFVPGTSVVNVPTLNSVSSADRAARVARYTFTTEPAGAIQTAIINGTITIPVA